jgi:hypothetical protein
MSRSTNVRLILAFALALTALLGTHLRAEEPSRLPTGPARGADLLDGAVTPRPPAPPTDPPGVLKEDRLPAVSELAARLSRDSGWLTPETLKALDERALGIDEIFDQAPRYVSIDGALYRVKLETVGGRWDGFTPGRDPFVVFLTHEVYDGLGDDRALGYQNGEEMILFTSDFEKQPAIALTFSQLTQDDRPAAGERVVDLHAKAAAPLALGKARSAVAFKPDGVVHAATPRPAVKSHCPVEAPPTACNGAQIQCPQDYQPYFIVSGLRVHDSHEGCCFAGDPEIEIYPLKIDSVSGVNGTTNATTQFVFSGRNIVDVAGRVRFLPDVDDGGGLYGMNVALVPANTANQFVGLMVEDDSEPGRLKVDNQSLNTSRLVDTGFQIFQDIRKMEYFELVKDAFSLIDILGFLSNDDDLFQPSLGATNNLFCSTALGGAFPHVYTMSTGQWEMQGYYACVNATCEGF